MSTKWIDSKKGEGVSSRLVAREFKAKGDKDRADLFPSTSPLDVVKAVVLARQDLGSDIVAVLIVVVQAHLNGRVNPEDGDHFIKLLKKMGGGCTMLNRLLSGMRLAARAWEEGHYCHLEETDMVRCKAAPTTFHKAATGTRCVVHDDDFTFVRPRKDLQQMTQMMA